MIGPSPSLFSVLLGLFHLGRYRKAITSATILALTGLAYTFGAHSTTFLEIAAAMNVLGIYAVPNDTPNPATTGAALAAAIKNVTASLVSAESPQAGPPNLTAKALYGTGKAVPWWNTSGIPDAPAPPNP